MTRPFTRLTLTRPLVIFDLEATGVNPSQDRIVEVALARFLPGSDPLWQEHRVYPCRPIPVAATAVHCITDADVACCPSFEVLAPRLWPYFADADWAGFGIARFDVPLLLAEFARAGLELPLADRAIIDGMQIFHRMEPRDLAAAVRFYCGCEPVSTHRAGEDVASAAIVLHAQLARYTDLPATPQELHHWLHPVDVAGCFQVANEVPVFAFGKHRGRALDAVAREAPDYLHWMLRQPFLEDVKRLVEDALVRHAQPA